MKHRLVRLLWRIYYTLDLWTPIKCLRGAQWECEHNQLAIDLPLAWYLSGVILDAHEIQERSA